jgi:AcrR family transcriptional regulator
MTTETETETARRPLSRSRVVQAAVVIADREGVDALTMRKLAAELGYEVMSLYNHVANKDDLLDAMVDAVAAEIDIPPADDHWKTAVRSIAMSAHDVLLRHQWASALWSNRWPGPARLRHMESILVALESAGLPAGAVDMGFHAITMHVQGFTLQKLSFGLAATLDESAARFLREVPADEYPRLTGHVHYHLAGSSQPGAFGFVLDLILDGLAQNRSGASSLT